jgi:hypothetical protein
MTAIRYRHLAPRVFAALLAVCAGLSSPESSADALRAVDSPASLGGAAARSRFARELESEVSAVLAHVGTPGAQDSAAVTEEFATIERLRDPGAVNVRALRLYESTAFQHLRLANTLAVLRDALACAASPYGALRREMECWAIAAACLADRRVQEEGIAALMRSGRITPGGGMTRGRWLALSGLWARYASAIQDHITIPYLRGAID